MLAFSFHSRFVAKAATILPHACPQVKSLLMIHYKGDQRTVYEDCQRFVDGLPIEDKVNNEILCI